MLAPWKKSYDQPRQHIKKQKHYFANTVCVVKAMVFLVVMTSLVTQMIKHPPTMRETQFRSMGWEDPLEKEVPTHSSTLAWKTPWTEEPGRLQSMGSLGVGYN